MHDTDTSALILQRAPRSPAAEAFRSLRTALQFLETSRTAVFVITSAGPAEGKTTMASNLAVAFAQVGKRVLLVDADMRRPSQHDQFSLGKGVGLSHLLARRGGDDLIQDPGIPGLSILPAGVIPPNPAEMLDSAALDECVTRWRKNYDHVIIDSPPVLAVTDPVVIARKVGYALLVARAATTRDKSLQRACQVLREAGVQLLGTALNDLEATRNDEYGYGYYAVDSARSSEP